MLMLGINESTGISAVVSISVLLTVLCNALTGVLINDVLTIGMVFNVPLVVHNTAILTYCVTASG